MQRNIFLIPNDESVIFVNFIKTAFRNWINEYISLILNMNKEEMRLLFNVLKLDHNASQNAPKKACLKDPLGSGQYADRVTSLDQVGMGSLSAVENQLLKTLVE